MKKYLASITLRVMQIRTTKRPGGWLMPVILALRRLRSEGSWFEVNLDKIVLETPSQPTKTGHGNIHLSSQLPWKHK
jgi:hypothetical protein